MGQIDVAIRRAGGRHVVGVGVVLDRVENVVEEARSRRRRVGGAGLVVTVVVADQVTQGQWLVVLVVIVVVVFVVVFVIVLAVRGRRRRYGYGCRRSHGRGEAPGEVRVALLHAAAGVEEGRHGGGRWAAGM